MRDTAKHPADITTPAASRQTYHRVFPGTPGQIRQARKFLAAALVGCPVADDVVLCLSELATNSVLHSSTQQPGGRFTVRAEVHDGDYVWVEVEDDGGPWNQQDHRDGRPHGLDIVRELASAWGIDGDALTGWVAWARLDWTAPDHPDRPSPPAPQR